MSNDYSHYRAYSRYFMANWFINYKFNRRPNCHVQAHGNLIWWSKGRCQWERTVGTWIFESVRTKAIKGKNRE